MKRLSSFLNILGADRRQFRTSIAVAIIGFIVVFILMPPRARSAHDPAFINDTLDAFRIAGYFVVAVIALFCAVNAYRDKDNVSGERVIILAWCIALCLWMLISVSGLLNWWGRLRPEIKPHGYKASNKQHNKALQPTAYSFARSSLRFQRRLNLVVVLVRAAYLYVMLSGKLTGTK